MCTLIALHRCFPEVPLAVAANRDEYLDRPAEALAVRRWGGRSVVAPRDVRAGGTWLGLNDAGLFAALTNRPCGSPDPGRRSRGLLVADLLAQTSAVQAVAALGRTEAAAYNPFNVFVSDGVDAYAVVYEDKPAVMELSAGAHVIGNADPDARDVPKVARLLGESEQLARGAVRDLLPGLETLCRSHAGSGSALERTCIHAGGYGTRSSTLLLRGGENQADVLRFADGPPCETEYTDCTPLLGELARSAGPAAGAR